MAKETELSELAVTEIKDSYSAEPSVEETDMVVEELEAQCIEIGKEVREKGMFYYWSVAKLLREKEAQLKVSMRALIRMICADNRIKHLQLGETTLKACLKAYKWDPKMTKVYRTEFGDNISWNKVKAMLTIPKPRIEPTIDEIAMKLYEKLGKEKTQQLIQALEKVVKEYEKSY